MVESEWSQGYDRRMRVDPIPPWLVWFAPTWIFSIILLSIVVRRVRGKPIFPRIPDDALFVERKASGPWAANCLIVAVSPDAILVTPFFPFNLMFLPEIYGLEVSIPVDDVLSVAEARHFGSNILVIYGEAGKKLRLRLRDPAAFVATLGRVRA